MPQVVRFEAPYRVRLADVPPRAPGSGEVRVRTLFSGISAGTELTAYRGTNPYVSAEWDAASALFHPRDVGAPGGRSGSASGGYPLEGWGYSEVGKVVQVGPDCPDPVSVGDVVWGIWGHRSEAVLAAATLSRQILPAGVAPEVGCFARVGSVALNAVLAAECGIGSTVVVLGQGVIGLLATAFASRSGARVVAVDRIAARRDRALRFGADAALAPGPEVAGDLREQTDGLGADVVIELSGSDAALHEATRIAGPEAMVVAAGFYQGPAGALRLGEEFHHNRVELVCSQIGGVPPALAGRWDADRLNRTFLSLAAQRAVDPVALVTHRVPAAHAAQAYEVLDQRPTEALQIVLDYTEE